MNFYKRHLGDFAKSCGHLSQGQQGAYDLLLDWLYGNEKPLPPIRETIYRIARATNKVERNNTDAVLAEFFTEEDDGYHQKRVTQEIAKANAQADTNRRIAEEREARKRTRTEHESFNEPPNDSCTNRQPSQTPDTRHQTKASEASATILENASTAGLACRLMKEAGCARTNPSHPDLLAALAEGITGEALADTVREAIDGGKTNPFTYAITTARSRRAEGARPVITGPPRIASASRTTTGLTTILEGTRHDPRTHSDLVLDTDPRGAGYAVRPEPRKLSGV